MMIVGRTRRTATGRASGMGGRPRCSLAASQRGADLAVTANRRNLWLSGQPDQCRS